ncbi:MAG: PEGA domain-containing protein [Deltaproteobacteria bacterium]|nr:PEGA domain-containing protein [Deltaproteobacteria bacterium]
MRRSFGQTAFVVCVTLAVPAASRADDLTTGVRLFHEGEFELSLAALARATARLSRGTERARAHLFVGLGRAVLGEWPAARDAFKRALADDPEISPDASRVRPAILDAFDAVRRTLRGILEVRVTERATVWIDGAAVGRAPVKVERPIGRHRVEARRLDGFAELRLDGVLVRVGETTLVEGRLTPKMGKVALESDPRGAAVFEGKRRVATTPVSGLTMPAGSRRLRFELLGFRPAEHELFVNPDAPSRLRVSLTPLDDRPFLKRRRSWAYLTAGASAALLTTGVVFSLLARSAESEIDSRAREGTLDNDRQQTLADSANGRALAANVFYGVGAAAAVTSIVLFLLRDGATASVSANVAIARGGVIVWGKF